MRRACAVSFVAALFLGAALRSAAASPKAPDPLDAPPAGLVPATVQLSDVLARYRAAAGKRRAKTSIEDWVVQEDGLNGTEHDLRDGDDYRDEVTLGPFTTQYGSRSGQGWWQNENGQTLLVSGVHEGGAVSGSALRGAESASSPYVTLLGQTAAAPLCYVVEVAPPGGLHEWVFYDAQSAQIVRVEQVEGARRVVYSYADFRTTNGAMRPWHIHVSDGLPANDEDYRLTALQDGIAIPATDLAVPANRRKLVEFPPGVSRVKLPASIVNGSITLRLTAGGRGFDVMLDSGASGIVLDRNLVVRDLGLPTYGKVTQTIAGQFDRSRSVVPEIQIGALRMHDVAVSTLPLAFDTSEQVKDVGLLGYDFISEAVIHVDYQHGTVEAIDPAQFDPSTLKDEIEVPVALDDGVPLVSARVGGARSNHFILDTGSSGSVLLFSQFVRAHPDDVKDESGGRFNIFNPDHTAEGVGGRLKMLPTKLDRFFFGLVSFEDFEIERLDGSPSFEGEDEDGLIGYEILKFYDLYFDYGHARIVLVPNDLLRRSLKPPPAAAK